MKKIKFKSILVPLVMSGVKDSTWRIFDDKDLSIGDVLALVNADAGEEFAKATITSVREKKLGEVEDTDFEEHERYESKDKMYETFRGYYGDKVGADSVIKIIKFKLKV